MNERELGAKAVKKLRSILDLTQAQLAARLGVSTIAIIQIENERNRLSVEMNNRIRVTFGATCLRPLLKEEKKKVVLDWVPFPKGDVKPLRPLLTLDGKPVVSPDGDILRPLSGPNDPTFTKADCSKHYAMVSSEFDRTVNEAQDALRELFEDARALPSDPVKQSNLPSVVDQFYLWLAQTKRHMKFKQVVTASKPTRKKKDSQ